MVLLPLAASPMRFGVRFCDVTPMLFTVLLSEEEAVPEYLQYKDIPASASSILCICVFFIYIAAS